MSRSKQKTEELVAEIHKANGVLEEVRLTVAGSFSEAVTTNSRDPQKLAKALSERFKTMRITVSFEQGEMAIFAQPAVVKFVPDTDRPDYLDHVAQKALAASATVNSQWPSYTELVAYAKGYEAGVSSMADLEGKLKELRMENDRLRENSSYMHPFMMMRGPFGRY